MTVAGMSRVRARGARCGNDDTRRDAADSGCVLGRYGADHDVRLDVRYDTDDGFGTQVLCDAIRHQISWRDVMHGRVAERRMSLAL